VLADSSLAVRSNNQPWLVVHLSFSPLCGFFHRSFPRVRFVALAVSLRGGAAGAGAAGAGAGAAAGGGGLLVVVLVALALLVLALLVLALLVLALVVLALLVRCVRLQAPVDQALRSPYKGARSPTSPKSQPRSRSASCCFPQLFYTLSFRDIGCALRLLLVAFLCCSIPCPFVMLAVLSD
jgi:hypothetical protein